MSARLENEIKIEQSINNTLKEMPNFISLWNNNMKASKKTVVSRRDYINKAKQYLLFINNNLKDIKLTELTEDKTVEYMTYIQTKENKDGLIMYTSDSYQQCVWCCLNNLFKFLLSRNMVDVNPMDNIQKTKNKDLVRINEHRILLTKEDFESILESVDSGVGSSKAILRQAPLKERDKSIIMLFMSTGMRREALAEINLSDIDFENNKLSVVDKGNINHYYHLSDNVMAHINKWLDKRESVLKGKESDALFITYQGNRITGNSIYNLIDKYSQDALGYHISPHKLRAGFCSILYNETHDAEFVRRAVGHSNISTTQRYITTDNSEREKAAEIMSSIF